MAPGPARRLLSPVLALALVATVAVVPVAPAGATAEAPFSGLWQSVDIDDSNQTLSFGAGLDASSRQVELYDDLASGCGEPPDSANASGTGTVEGSLIVVSFTVFCHNNPDAEPFQADATFAYDEASDTLTDNFEVVWTRFTDFAEAGSDQLVSPGAEVTLEGSGPFPADIPPGLTFGWRQISGTSMDLTSTDGATTSFTAPSEGGDLVFELTVTTGHGDADTDTVTVTVVSVTAEVGSDLVLYGVNSADDGLSIIDQATGEVTFIGPLDPDPTQILTPVAMAVHPDNQALYVWNNSGPSGVLLTVDRCTGLGSVINAEASGQVLQSLAFHPDGRLFGLGGSLFQIDLATGMPTSVGSIGMNIAGADFSPDGVLYGLELLTPNRLVTIDTNTGESELIAALDGIGTVGSIAFDPQGTLIGSHGGTPGNRLFDIDPSSGAVSNFRDLVGGSNVQGMGFAPPCQEDPEPDPGDSEPTLSGVELTVDQGVTPVGVGAVPIRELPIERLSAAGGAVAGTPLASIDLSATPLASIPLASIPLASIGTGDSPLTSILLSSLVLHSEGGWDAVLEGTELEGKPHQTITLGELLALSPAPSPLASITLAELSIAGSPLASISLAALALGALPLASIDSSLPNTTLLELEASGGSIAPSTLGSTPLASIDLSATPLASIPLASIPLASIPLASIPLASIPLASIDLVGTPLASIPLASIPLASIPLASIDIAGSPLASIPLASIDVGGGGFCNFLASESGDALTCASLGIDESSDTLGDLVSALGATPLASTPLASIPLASIPLASIPLASIPLASIPLASINLSSTALASTPLGSIPLASIDLPDGRDFCEFLETESGGILTCTGLGITDPATATLTEFVGFLEGQGSSLAASPLASIPLASIPLASIPLASIDLATVELAGTPLASIPLASIAIAGSPLASIPLASIPLASIDVVLVDTHGDLVDVGTDTLADAVAAGAIRPDATLGDLGFYGSASLGDLVDALTLAFLYGGGTLGDNPDLGGLTFGDLLISFLLRADYPFEEVSLEAIRANQLFPTNLLTYDLGFLFGGRGAPVGTTIRVGNPTGFSHMPGTSFLEGVDQVSDASTTVSANCGADAGDGFTSLFQSFTPDAPTLAAVRLDLRAGGAFPDDGVPTEVWIRADSPSAPVLAEGRRFVSGPLAGGSRQLIDIPLDAPIDVTPGATYVIEWHAADIPLAWMTTLTDTYPGGHAFGCTGGANLDSDRLFETLAAFGDPGDPVQDGDDLIWSIPELSPGADYSLTYQVAPGLRLGTFGSSASVEVAGLPTQEVTNAAAVTVEEFFQGNDFPENAALIDPDVIYVIHVSEANDLEYFRFDAPSAGFRSSFFLSQQDSDNDLVMYRPATAPISEAEPRSIPLASIPIEDHGLDYGGSGTLPPETLADTPLASIPLASISTNRGTEDETVAATQRSEPTDGDQYVIQVSGYNGSFSPAPAQGRLKISREVPVPICSPRTFPGTGASVAGISAFDMSSLPAGLNTILLVNHQRLADAYGAGELSKLMDGDGVLRGVNALVDYVNTTNHALGLTAAVVPIDDIDYSAWDANPCDVDATNATVGAITGRIAQIREAHPTLRYVTIVGGDEIVPMARIPDLTQLANEATFTHPFSDNALFGSFVTRHFLSDDPYLDVDPIPWFERFLHVPDLAGGRLVETPEDMLGLVDSFIEFEGRLDPSTALTLGYDFLADGAEEVDAALAATLGDENTVAIINDVWTAQNLADAFLEPEVVPHIVSPNAHYDYHRALPAAEDAAGTEDDLFTIDDVIASDAALEGRIIFTMGCHAGLSPTDIAFGTAQPLDWAQTYAERGALFVGNTGYGYGDTVTVALSERLMALLATNLDGTMTIGQAHTFAKQEYFAHLGLYGVYDEKVLQESTLYGLPMFRIGDGDPAQAPPPRATAVDPITGLAATTISFDPDLQRHVSEIGDFYTADDGTQFVHYRPIQPLVSFDVTQPDLLARGAVLTSLVTMDETGFDAAYGRPVIDLAANEPEVQVPGTVFPTAFQTVGTFNAPTAPNADEPFEQRQRLNLIAGQFVADEVGDLGTQRTFTSGETVVFYAPPDSTDFDPPTILRSDAAIVDGSTVSFHVETADEDVVRVVVLYRESFDPATGKSVWQSVDLAQGSPWTGGAAVAPGTSEVDYLVQAVDAAGNVGVSTFKGVFHKAEALPPPPEDDSAGFTVALAPAPTTGSWFTEPVTVTINGAADIVYTATIDGVAVTLDNGSFTISQDGIHLVRINGSDGSEVVFGVAVDTTAPRIGVSRPVDGAVYVQHEEVAASYACVDPGSGVTECRGPVPSGALFDTATTGTHTFTVAATDAVSHTSTKTVSYTVVRLDASSDPVAVGEQYTVLLEGAGSATVDWGDGTTDPMAGDDTVLSATHVYEAAGIYTVRVTVDCAGLDVPAPCDDGVRTLVHEFAVVYDPTGGFVTGGGTIQSPPGAYSEDATIVGPASFGFVSRYQRGAKVPTGNTQFRFRAAEFRFQSEAYDWLVIAGPRAQYKGTGAVNGLNGYGFMLTAIDGDVPGGLGTDRFRLKVWDLITEEIVYDNVAGASDDVDGSELTTLTAGSIKIHGK